MKKKAVTSGIIFVIMVLVSASFIYPFIYMFFNSFKTKNEYLTNKFLPPLEKFTIDNIFTMVSQFKIFSYFKNTLIVTIFSLIIIIVISIFASYSFAKSDFPGKTIVYILLISTMFIPAQTMMIPMYSLYAKLGLINNYLSVIINYTATGLPSTILLLTSSFRGIPKDMIDASKIDGSGFIRTVLVIVTPIGKPVISISAIFSFLGYWNDLFTPMILLQKTEVKTVIVALTGLVQRYSNDPTYQMAGLLISVIPALIIFFVFQKNIVKGITMGSIK